MSLAHGHIRSLRAQSEAFERQAEAASTPALVEALTAFAAAYADAAQMLEDRELALLEHVGPHPK